MEKEEKGGEKKAVGDGGNAKWKKETGENKNKKGERNRIAKKHI